MPLPASPPLVAILSALIEERTGLHYGPQDQDTLIGKVQERAMEAGFDSLLDYYYYLRYDNDAATEFDKLVDALVVGETYFFRELQPLRVLVSKFVKPLVEQGKRPRIWSAACASGEEPLTLAMLLAHEGLRGQVDLIASDISTRALNRAHAGRFGRRSVRDVPVPELARRWLRESADGSIRVDASLCEGIDWRRINLCSPSDVSSIGPCEIILCRNVLIYFSDDTAAKIVNRLADLLTHGGVLCVGVSESLLRLGTALACEETEGAFYYKKVA